MFLCLQVLEGSLLIWEVMYQKEKPQTGALLAQPHVVLDVIVLDTPDVGTRKRSVSFFMERRSS
jgi:hypothetical protein